MILDNEFLSSLNMSEKELVFPIKQYDICYYNPRYFISIGFMFDYIIMDIYRKKVGNEIKVGKHYCFSKIKHKYTINVL